MKVQQSNPAFSFIIMAIANFLAMMVFGMLYLIYTNSEGERYVLLLIATVISLVSGVGMLVLYAYFQRRLDSRMTTSPTPKR